ncbi:hypothetical protein Ocin01_12093 [Orchesella cincta]|uniref:Uncharacterized protein n=1 Tax=Orchesella cincta TaxID=48709 RepID=A0A1D2MNS3_ORCCI|nr:hypothetical protein Ocin01_12093 [Orchesella cincta]
MSFPPNHQQQKRDVKVVELESETDSDEVEVVDFVAGSGDGVPFLRELDLEVIEDFGVGSRMRMNVGRDAPEIELIEEVAGRPRQEPIVYVLESSSDEEDEIDVVGTPRSRATTPEAEVEPQLSHSIQVGNDDLQQQQQQQEAEQPVDVAGGSGSVHDSDEDNQADHLMIEQLRLEALSDEKMKANETMNLLKGVWPSCHFKNYRSCHSNNDVSQGPHPQPSTSGSSSQSSPRLANFDARSGVSSSLFRVATEAECEESLAWWKLELNEEPDPAMVPSPEEQIGINDFRDAFLAAVLKVDKEFAEKEKRMSDSKQKKNR